MNGASKANNSNSVLFLTISQMLMFFLGGYQRLFSLTLERKCENQEERQIEQNQ